MLRSAMCSWAFSASPTMAQARNSVLYFDCASRATSSSTAERRGLGCSAMARAASRRKTASARGRQLARVWVRMGKEGGDWRPPLGPTGCARGQEQARPLARVFQARNVDRREQGGRLRQLLDRGVADERVGVREQFQQLRQVLLRAER